MQWRDLSLFLRRFSAIDLSCIQEAYVLGDTMHAGQTRKSGESYFVHPVAVAAMLAQLKADRDTIIAALLHDTVEDTSLTFADIEKQFGRTVANLIEGVTKLTAQELEEKPSLNQQIETLRKIFTLMQDDVRIMVIKLIDRLHNMQTVSFLSEKSQKMLAQETMDVYVKIADRLCMQDLRDEMEGLCRAILQPAEFAKLYRQKVENKAEGKRKIHAIKEAMALSSFAPLLEKTTLHFESKTWDQRQAQLESDSSAITGNAGITVVFVCQDLDNCYQILGMLHQLWIRETLSFQDFINAPVVNGYRGLHTTVIMADGTRVRCKIRTREMHAYARLGITTVCFNKEKSDLSRFLPWTKSISPLSTSTEGRSNDFWESLQNDILGESIIIHGPADETVLLPKIATALDGAFFLFHDQALHVDSIKVNGKTVPFSTPLKYADSLDVTLAESVTLSRDWLDWTKSGLATAAIRLALGKLQSKEDKIRIGKDMLQAIMTEKKKGFIEEFDQQLLLKRLSEQEYGSLNDVFAAIAEDRMSAIDIYKYLFENSLQENAGQKKVVRITYLFMIDDEYISEEINQVYKKYGDALKEMTQRREGTSSLATATAKIALHSTEQQIIKHELEIAGAQNVEIIVRTKREIFLLAGVILLWSLNPVIAKLLLIKGMHPISLITLRFLVFGLSMIAFFFAWKALIKEKYAPVPRLKSLASWPTFGFAGMSIYFYALAVVPPSIHLLILRFNSLLLPSIRISGGRSSNRRPLEWFILLILITISFILFTIGKMFFLGICMSVITLLFYTILSLSLEGSLQKNHIDVRSPYLLYQMGIFSTIIGAILIPFQPIVRLWNSLTLPAVLYILFCISLSQIFYSSLLRQTRFKHVTDIFLIEVPLTILFEITILGIVLPTLTYIVIAVVLLALLILRWRAVSQIAPLE